MQGSQPRPGCTCCQPFAAPSLGGGPCRAPKPRERRSGGLTSPPDHLQGAHPGLPCQGHNGLSFSHSHSVAPAESRPGRGALSRARRHSSGRGTGRSPVVRPLALPLPARVQVQTLNSSARLSSARLLPFNSSSPLPECLRWLCWPGQRRVPPHRGGGGWHGGAAPRARGAAPGDPLLGGPLSHQRTASCLFRLTCSRGEPWPRAAARSNGWGGGGEHCSLPLPAASTGTSGLSKERLLGPPVVIIP